MRKAAVVALMIMSWSTGSSGGMEFSLNEPGPERICSSEVERMAFSAAVVGEVGAAV